jgi:hypothetical protein
MKHVALVFAVITSFLLCVVVFTAGITRPKAILGMGAFAAAFWYYHWDYRRRDAAKRKKEPPPLSVGARDWRGQASDDSAVKKEPNQPPEPTR